jgi:tetratricopeptide (TPR) repeat protein
MDQEGWPQRVEALIDLGRLDEARRLLVTVLAGDPMAAAALRLLAFCDYQRGDGPAAPEAADRAIAAEPENEWGHRLRAWALLLLGEPDAAMSAALETVRLEPEGWAGHHLGIRLTGKPTGKRTRVSVIRAAAAMCDQVKDGGLHDGA